MRFGRDPMQELRRIELVRDLATCGVVRSEVARGLREPKLLKKFQARWDVMLYVPTDNALWSDVEAVKLSDVVIFPPPHTHPDPIPNH